MQCFYDDNKLDIHTKHKIRLFVYLLHERVGGCVIFMLLSNVVA